MVQMKIDPGDTNRQDAVVQRIRLAAGGDARICAVELSGSLERGEGDYFSDVDLGIRVTDQHFFEIARDKSAFIRGLCPTLAIVDAYDDENFSTCGCLFPNLVCGDIAIIRRGFQQHPPESGSVDDQARATARVFLQSAQEAAYALRGGQLWLARSIVEGEMRFQLFRFLDLFEAPPARRWPGRQVERLLERLGIGQRIEDTACVYSGESVGRALELLLAIFREQFCARLSSDVWERVQSREREHDRPSPFAEPSRSRDRTRVESSHAFWYEIARNIHLAGRGELWFARFNHETCVMEPLLRMIAYATSARCRWVSRALATTVESIEQLPAAIRPRLVGLCQRHSRRAFWETMHAAMEWFAELADQSGLAHDANYPSGAQHRLPRFAQTVGESRSDPR